VLGFFSFLLNLLFHICTWDCSFIFENENKHAIFSTFGFKMSIWYLNLRINCKVMYKLSKVCEIVLLWHPSWLLSCIVTTAGPIVYKMEIRRWLTFLFFGSQAKTRNPVRPKVTLTWIRKSWSEYTNFCSIVICIKRYLKNKNTFSWFLNRFRTNLRIVFLVFKQFSYKFTIANTSSSCII